MAKNKPYGDNARVGVVIGEGRVTTLGEMVEEDRPITYGIVKPGHGCPGGVPVVKVKDMQDDAIDESDLLLTTPELDHQYRRSRLRAGDLLISIRGSVGRMAEIPLSLENANITQDTARLTISSQYNRIYVRGVLESPILQWDMEKNIRGVAVKGINIGYLRELKMPVCDRERQDEVAMLYQQSDKSKFIGFKSQFIEMFVDPESVIDNAINTVADVADVQVGLVIKPTRFYSADGTGTPAFRSLNIGEMYIRDSEWVYFTDKGMVENQRTIAHTGDVLVVRSGYPGTSCVVTSEYDGRNVVDLIIAHPNVSKILPEFLGAFTNYPHGKIQIENSQRGVAQKHFNVSLYNKMKIVIPPMELQKQFVQLLHQSDKSK